jgi:hypothetical protein
MKLQCGPSMMSYLLGIYLYIFLPLCAIKRYMYIVPNNKMVYISQKGNYLPRHHWRFTLYTVHLVREFSGAQKFKFIENLEPLWKPGDSLIDLHFTFLFLSEILQRPTRRYLSPRKSSLRPEEKAKTIVSKKELCPKCQFSHRIAFLK